MKEEFLCVVCPNGCMMNVEFTDEQPRKFLSASGQGCPRGLEWARQEVERPLRTISSSILVKNGEVPLASVRTTAPIPLSKVMDVMKEIKGCVAIAPLRIGDIILTNPAGTDTDVMVTRNVAEVLEKIGRAHV